MNIDGLIKTYMEGERECFEFTEYLKHNPVLYPRVGDIFLRELFILANPDRKPPYCRRKKAQMDNLWHKVSKKTLAQYLIGCEIVKNSNLQLDFELENGNKIPFSAYWYLICLFLGRAEELSTQNLQEELIAKLKKEKAQKGICKPDARKYYKTIGLLLDQVASDFPLTKNYCPMKLEYVCKENCPTTLKLGGMELARGLFHYREKEDLLFLYASQKGHLPKELIAGEMLFQFIRKEYSAFLSVPFDQFEMETDWNKEHFNCQLFGVFAYIMDALCISSFLLWQNTNPKEMKTEQQFWEEGLFQLADLSKENWDSSIHNLAWVITLAELINPYGFEEGELQRMEFDMEESLAELKAKKGLTILSVNHKI